jgi:trk system potassium uptake protein TrkA
MKFSIIGLGYFGSSLVEELVAAGHEVIAIDTDISHIRQIEDTATLAAQADGTDIEALKQLDVDKVDVAVVAIGEGFEASLMITAHCQSLGIGRVYTRVINNVHEHILGLMKVTGTIQAERLAASNFARHLVDRNVHRYLDLDETHAIVEMEAPEWTAGLCISELDLRSEYSINIITIKRLEPNGDEESTPNSFTITGTPTPNTTINRGDRLVLFGKFEDIKNLGNRDSARKH